LTVGVARDGPSLFTSTSFRIGRPRRSRDLATIATSGSKRQFTGCIIEGSLNSPLHVLSLSLLIMFRTAARSFAASAWRSAESISQLEAANQTAINISKAQGIGQRGFLDGKLYLFYELI
jgi:hypothetical protein